MNDEFRDNLRLVIEEADQQLRQLRRQVETMPVARFTAHPLWPKAGWSATTYQWHPTSEAPPVMGLVFDDEDAGIQIFTDAKGWLNHEDRFEEIRISVIQDEIIDGCIGEGYSVQIGVDPEALAGYGEVHDFGIDPALIPLLGQWNRHYPDPKRPSLLRRFQEEFDRHREFLLAPTKTHSDGNRYMVPELGIVKNLCSFRNLSDIDSTADIDAVAHLLPQFTVTPHSQEEQP